jgi:NarL family two-component system response regulator LiaR
VGFAEEGLTAIVADELELVAAGVASVFERRGVATVATARDTRSAVRLARQHRPDVVVLGTSSDGPADERAVRAVKQALPRCLVVALVNGDQVGDLAVLLAAGTDALLPRAIDLASLADMLARALAGERVVAPGLVPSLLSRTEPKAQRGQALLTSRERDVLERIASGRSNRQIAEELFVGEETVKSHCSKIYDKLGAKNRHDAVARGLSLGVLG